MATRTDIGVDSPWFVGASRRFVIPMVDASGDPKTISGASVASWRVTTISPLEGSVGSPAIEKTLGAGVTITGTSEVTIEVDEADTVNLAAGDYYHEFRVTDAAGDTATTNYGTVRLTASAF